MARRRGFFRRARRAGRRGFSGRRGRSSNNNGGLLMTAGGAAIYGAARQKLSDLAQPLTNNIPLGNVSDEVVLGVAGYYLAKKSSMPLLKSIGRAAMTIEAARIGEAVATGALGGMSTASSGSNSNFYG